MPPPAVKTYRDLVCYEWAKAIARSSGFKDNFAFIMSKMTKLKAGELHMSEIVREDRLMAVEEFKACAYCGAAEELSWDHLVPTSKGRLDTISNNVPACRGCNSSKGDKELLEWYRTRKGVYIPRLVWGKYLKMIYEDWDKQGILDQPLPLNERDRWSGLRVE